MKIKAVGFGAGLVFGFLIAWSRVSDPVVIRKMLLLREADVFLLMGSAIMVAAMGGRLLRYVGARAVFTGEPIAWVVQRPARRHIVGSALFGIGWSVAATCPAPIAAMIGAGKIAALPVAGGLLIGVALQPHVARALGSRSRALPSPAAVGL